MSRQGTFFALCSFHPRGRLVPLLMALSLTVFVGCSGDKAPNKEKGHAKKDAPSKEAGGKGGGQVVAVDDSLSIDGAVKAPEAKPVDRKVIYTATLQLQVENFAAAEEDLMALVEQHKGLLEKSEVDAQPGSPRSGRWRVRISPDDLPAFRKAAAKLGVAEQNRLDSQEVTEEFYDLLEQIKNKDRELESYRRLFEQAKGVPDIIAVKKELDRTQAELDRLKGRHKLLQNMTGLTTVNIWLHERGAYIPDDSPDFGTSAGRTFSGSFGALVKFGRGTALVAVAVAPWLPLLLVALLPLFIWRRRLRAAALKLSSSPLPVLESANPDEHT